MGKNGKFRLKVYGVDIVARTYDEAMATYRKLYGSPFRFKRRRK